MNQDNSLFELLEIPLKFDLDYEEIETAYDMKSLEFQDDENKLEEVNNAYEIIISSYKRIIEILKIKYDKDLSGDIIFQDVNLLDEIMELTERAHNGEDLDDELFARKDNISDSISILLKLDTYSNEFEPLVQHLRYIEKIEDIMIERFSRALSGSLGT